MACVWLLDWCRLSLHLTMFEYPYTWSNNCTHAPVCTLNLFKRLEVLIKASGQVMVKGTQSCNESVLGCGTVVYKGNQKELLPNYSLLLLGLCARWVLWEVHRPTPPLYLWYGITKQGRDRSADLKNVIQSINGVLKTEPHI